MNDDNKLHPKVKDLTGQLFGKLRVITCAGKNKWGQYTWLCKCECGVEKIIRGCGLRIGDYKTCGNIGCSISAKLPKGTSSKNKVIRNYRKNARSRGIKFNLTLDQCNEFFQSDCFYCGSNPSNISNAPGHNGSFVYSGIDRIENTKDYTIKNCVPCCRKCNRAKDTMTSKQFLEWIAQVYEHHYI
jgi:hypothetical protein